MTHYTKVIHGLMAYLDAEVISKISGSLNAWMVGAALELAASNAEGIFRQLQNNPALNMLNVIDGENVDVDKLYAALRKRAQISPATLSIPLLGPITFSASDLDALYRHIKGA